MKTLKFKRGGLWHRLVTTYSFDQTEPTDICEKIKYTLQAMLSVLLCITVGVCAGVLVLDTLLWLYVWYEIGYVSPGGPAVASLMLFTGVLIYFMYTKTKDRAMGHDSFLKEAYLATKNKYCVKVEYEA